jgi:hypothetical protein
MHSPAAGYMGNWTSGRWPDLLFLPSAFDGGIDEVALYEEAIPDALIRQHYQQMILHQPYTFELNETLSNRAIPPDPPPHYDLKEFAPGSQLPTMPSGVPGVQPLPTTGVNISALQQLRSYPLPRYQLESNYSTRLQRLGNCMNSQYLAGENQKNTTNEGVANLTTAINHELASHWNYLVALGNIRCTNTSDQRCGLEKKGESVVMQTVELLNSNPSFGFEYYLTRLNNQHPQVGHSGNNCDGNQSLPDPCYLRNGSDGPYINYDAHPVNCTGCISPCRVIRPLVTAAGRAKYCPDELFTADVFPFLRVIEALTTLLDRPIERVW